MSRSVTIIGGGLAGAVAALAARQAGAAVSILPGRPGATAFASGAWDIGGDAWHTPRAAIERVVLQCPDHPYTHLSRRRGVDSVVELITQALQALTQAMPAAPTGSLDRNRTLVTPLGTLKYCAYADPAQAAGDITQIKGGRLLVVGIRGLLGFSPQLIVPMLQQDLEHYQLQSFSQLAGDWLELENIPQHSLSPLTLAGRLEEPACFASLVSALSNALRKHRATHVLLPPVIGLEKSVDLLSELSRALKVTCFESVAALPSVPGLRRHRRLEQVLAAGGIKQLTGWVEGVETEGSKISALVVRRASQTETHAVDRLILTTGRFLGGGLKKVRQWHESLLGLPVYSGHEILGDRFVGKLVGRHYHAAHELFCAGLKVDHQQQPLGLWGERPYDNLYAAGSLLGGYDASAAAERSGVVLASAWAAGTLAAQS